MSYDLDAFRMPAGMPPKSLIELLETGEAEEHALELSGDDRERLAVALLAVDAAAERHDHDDEVEIENDGLQLFIAASGVTVNVPYHGLGDGGETPMDRAFAYADVMTAHGLTVWDPQAESIVTGDDGDALRTATDRFGATSDLADRLTDPDPTPRWKFWKRD
jgi:hypothetical protein